jgi:hypothetical protein
MPTRPIYSVRIFGEAGVDGGTNAFGPPEGHVWILRDVDAYAGGYSSGVNLFIEDGETGGALVHLSWDPFVGGGRSWRGRQVVDTAGIRPRVDGGLADIFISGYLLTKP